VSIAVIDPLTDSRERRGGGADAVNHDSRLPIESKRDESREMNERLCTRVCLKLNGKKEGKKEERSEKKLRGSA